MEWFDCEADTAVAEPDPVETTDEDLLLAYRATGDPEAFNALASRYSAELLAYLRSYTGDMELSEDALNETWLKVHSRVALFEPGRKVKPWLYTVASNAARDLLRKEERHRGMVRLGAFMDNAFNPENESDGRLDSLGPLEDPHDGPETNAVVREDIVRVRAALERLWEVNADLAACIEYVDIRGMKYREAADAIGILIGTVKSRLHTARRALGVIMMRMGDVPVQGGRGGERRDTSRAA